ncbi:hypothetical protein BAE44_0012434, partial [Dichanthelium oligosanthes]
LHCSLIFFFCLALIWRSCSLFCWNKNGTSFGFALEK